MIIGIQYFVAGSLDFGACYMLLKNLKVPRNVEMLNVKNFTAMSRVYAISP